jgi:hypothetical protein
MLFSLLLSLTNPADACAAPISVDSTFPISGDTELAPDAIFQVRLSCQHLWEDPQFVVEQNGEVVEADVRIHRRMITADSEEVFVEVNPVEDLKPGSSILLSVDYFGMRTAAATFVVGEEWTMPEILEVPNIYWISTSDVSDEEPEGECWIQKEGQIDFDLDVAPEGQAIRLYEIDPELRFETLSADMLQAPFHTVIDMNSWEDMSALIPADKLNGEDMCFAATFINEGGVESLPSEVRCVSDMEWSFEGDCFVTPFSCSTMQPTDLGWMAMVMGVFGMLRRRRF